LLFLTVTVIVFKAGRIHDKQRTNSPRAKTTRAKARRADTGQKKKKKDRDVKGPERGFRNRNYSSKEGPEEAQEVFTR